jgi:hypothetical protein
MLYTRCQAANHRVDPGQHRERFQLGQTPGTANNLHQSRVSFLVHDSIALWIFGAGVNFFERRLFELFHQDRLVWFHIFRTIDSYDDERA